MGDDITRRPVGRPPSRSIGEIQTEEALQQVKLSAEIRKMVVEQLEKLKADLEGITNIEQRKKTVKDLIGFLSELSKTTKITSESAEKDKGEKEEDFNFEKFAEEARK
jgi:hypothetical protein